ncbi:MAG: alkaline phosphatase [Sulfuritalea sp.]|nr:alkaline phosphatase [Sulfuritalea sp.]
MRIHSVLAGALLAAGLLTVGAAQARGGDVGNVIFLHPDGTGLNHWTAARIYWKGPDGSLNWDRLPQMAAYRGHMLETLTGTSNGGATVHAFGYKVEGLGSFGKDGNGNAIPPTDRFINALSGYPGSILREAANQGYPTGLVNDGNVGEPGTGAFAAEVGNRDNWNAIALQIIAGRDGALPAKNSTDKAPVVILGGGERNFLPTGTPACAPQSAGAALQQGVATYPLDCMVHTLDWSKPGGTAGPLGIGRVATPDRTDGRNLLAEAADAGYLVIRTRAEFETAVKRLESDRRWQPKILGLFAAHHTFNDRNEEELSASGFRDASIEVNDKSSNLVLFGNPAGADPGFNPPRGDEMMSLAMIVLARAGEAVRKPYFLVAEPESNDNFGNNNNAIGMLLAMKVADDMLGVALGAQNDRRAGRHGSRFPITVLTAADSDASGMQLVARPAGNAGTVNLNPAAGQSAANNPVDGLYGRGTQLFAAAPDQFGNVHHFGIAWAGTPDFAGGILARASEERFKNRDHRGKVTLADFSERFDNTDVYRYMYDKLFGILLPAPTGGAPSR